MRMRVFFFLLKCNASYVVEFVLRSILSKGFKTKYLIWAGSV